MPPKATTTQKETVASRLKIGFAQEPSAWRDAQANFTQNDLTILGHPVMQDWETPYMMALAQTCCAKHGDILEIGFGMGIASRFIQEQEISSHWIIEANAEVAKRAKMFAAEHENVIASFGFWERVCGIFADSSFSGILFDTYPMKENQLHCNHYDFFPEGHRLLKPGGILTYYSDEAEDYSTEHMQKLKAAGFKKIGKRICPVKPPPDCLYWQHNSLLVPIVVK